MTTASASFARAKALVDDGLLYRVARVFLLCLLIIIPMEAITAAREIAMAGAALFLLLHLLVVGPRRFRPTILFLPLCLYAACALLSLWTAVDFAYSLKELRSEVLKGLIIFYAGVHFVDREDNLSQCWWALMAGAGLMIAAGLFLFFSHGGDLLHHQVRAGSLHSGYGTFGTYLVTIWPFILLLPWAFPQRRVKVCWPVLLAACALAAYLTYSRASWLAMLVQLGLVLVVLGRHRLRRALLGAALGVVILGVLFMAPGARHGEKWQRLWDQPQEVGGSMGDLAALWKHSIKKIAEDPFTGIGLGRHSFSKAYPEFRRTHQPLLWHAHNMFIQLTLEMGVQGLVAVLLTLGVLVWALWPQAPPSAGQIPQLFGAATAIMAVGFAVRNLTDDFFVDDSALLFWLLAGLAMGARKWREE